MTLKFCKTYYLLHNKFMIDFQSIEYIFNNMKIKNVKNILKIEKNKDNN